MQAKLRRGARAVARSQIGFRTPEVESAVPLGPLDLGKMRLSEIREMQNRLYDDLAMFFFKETKIPVLESYRRYKSSQNFHIDCLRVAPQTYIFLESGDRDLSIGVLGSGRKLFSSELQMETFAGPRIFR